MSNPTTRDRSEEDILMRLLAPVIGKISAKSVSGKALRQAGGLGALARSPGSRWQAPPGWTEDCSAAVALAWEFVERSLESRITHGETLASPADSVRYLRAHLARRRREVFSAVFLDTRHRVIALEELFRGSLDGAAVYPRVVAERALRLDAAAVIVAHNHPSGIAEPSLADQAITRRLAEALSLLEIRLLDHFVIATGQTVSMASRGML